MTVPSGATCDYLIKNVLTFLDPTHRTWVRRVAGVDFATLWNFPFNYAFA